MLNIAIAQKAELFQKTNASPCASRVPQKLSESYKCVSTSGRSGSFECFIDAFPVNTASRSVYEWITPPSVTSKSFSPVEMIKALLAVSESQLETSREKADLAVKNALISIYELDRAGFGRLAAQEVMLFVESNLRRNGINETNRLLELVDVSKLSNRSLIGLIRSTARLKDKLPAWKLAYLNSRTQVTKQGKNPDTLFVGLS